MGASKLSLETLAPLPGSRERRKRVGRGESSGMGKTSTHGGKGQTARSGGGTRAGFEGGQMPLYKRMGKIGFRSRQKGLGTNRFDVINVGSLNTFEAGSVVDPAAVLDRGFGRTNRTLAGLKILGEGELTKKLTVKAHMVSAGARKKIEAAGGTVELIGGQVASA